MEAGFATCAGGDADGAKAKLTEALAIAESGAAERFNAELAEQTTTVSAVSESVQQEADTQSDDKPWWRFW